VIRAIFPLALYAFIAYWGKTSPFYRDQKQ